MDYSYKNMLVNLEIVYIVGLCQWLVADKFLEIEVHIIVINEVGCKVGLCMWGGKKLLYGLKRM